jgi:NTE family protein
MREIPQLRKKPGTALVLSGGATKAFYFHLGVLKALREERFTSIVGSSAGAVMGTFLAFGATADTILPSIHQKQIYFPKFDAWIKTLTSSDLFKPKYPDIFRQGLHTYLSLLKLMTTLPSLINRDVVSEVLDALVNSQSRVDGFFDASAIEDLFKTMLRSSEFGATDIDLYITGTGLDDGRRAVFNSIYNFYDDENEFLTNVPITKAVRASAAIPGMFEPVEINGKYYIDGEVKQTLSADLGVQLADRVIISHTYQPLRLTNGSIRDMGWLSVFRQSLIIAFNERIQTWRQIYQGRYPDKEIIWIEPDPEDEEFFRAPEFSFRPEVQERLIYAGEMATLKAFNTARLRAFI